MKEELLTIVEHSKREIKKNRKIIDDIRAKMLESCEFSVDEKVKIIILNWDKIETGEIKEGFIFSISCDDDLDFHYKFLAVKKDGTPSKNSAGIWTSNIKLEKIKI